MISIDELFRQMVKIAFADGVCNPLKDSSDTCVTSVMRYYRDDNPELCADEFFGAFMPLAVLLECCHANIAHQRMLHANRRWRRMSKMMGRWSPFL